MDDPVTAGRPAPPASRELWVCQLGTVDPREAWALQGRVRAARQEGLVPDVLLVLEHPPVYTRGRRTQPGELPLGDAWYRERGIEVLDVDRGGRVTYHGPGQVVGYPVVKVDNVLRFVHAMEDAIVAALADEGVGARGRTRDGREFIGVWVEDRKIASIGIHLSRGVTTHGLAVNVANDLEPFAWVVPCGLDGVAMTSVARELGRDGDRVPCFRKRLAYRFAQALGRRQRLVSLARLEAAVAAPAAPQLA
jgi:lipoyl(octanoyl) transferase